MAKDYFQDIIPPSNDASRAPRKLPVASVPQPEVYDESADDTFDEEEVSIGEPTPERSIRNISIPQSRVRNRSNPEGDQLVGGRPVPPPFHDDYEKPRPRRVWIWALALVLVLFLGGIAIVATRPTTVTITPRSQPVTFGPSPQYVAYPADTAATGTLSYIMQSYDIEDSDAVAAQGMQHVETKASGSITVYNDYSATPMRLIKDTRFATPDGLIFRIPADVVIPGKSAKGPGQVNVTVVADVAGDKYNIGPTARFTVPGLKSAPSFSHVYGVSTVAMSGGAAGDQPGVAPAVMSAAIAGIRARLEQKAHALLSSSTSTLVTFPGLAQISYQDLPNTDETGGSVRLHQKAHVTVPAFPADLFSLIIAKSVSADAETSSVRIVPGEGYDATVVSNASSTPTIGSGPLTFTLAGKAQLIWAVDAAALQKALAGRDQGAFQTVINGFAGVQEAHARVEPFWKATFPTDSTQIKVIVKDVSVK